MKSILPILALLLIHSRLLAQGGEEGHAIEITGIVKKERGSLYLRDATAKGAAASAEIMLPAFTPQVIRPGNLCRIPLFFHDGD